MTTKNTTKTATEAQDDAKTEVDKVEEQAEEDIHASSSPETWVGRFKTPLKFG